MVESRLAYQKLGSCNWTSLRHQHTKDGVSTSLSSEVCPEDPAYGHAYFKQLVSQSSVWKSAATFFRMRDGLIVIFGISFEPRRFLDPSLSSAWTKLISHSVILLLWLADYRSNSNHCGRVSISSLPGYNSRLRAIETVNGLVNGLESKVQILL